MLRRISKSIGLLIASTSLALLLGFLTVAINSRVLGAEGVGIIALYQASAAMALGIFSIGSQQPMIRLSREALERGEVEKVGVIAGLAMELDAISTASAGVLAIIGIVFLSEYIGIAADQKDAALIYTLVIFSSATATPTAIFRLFDSFHLIAKLDVAQAATILAVTATLSLISARISTYLTCYALTYTLINISKISLAVMLLNRRSIHLHFGFAVARQNNIWNEYAHYAWTTFGTSTLNTVRQQADVVLLGILATPSMTGIYAVIKQLVGICNKVSNAYFTVVFPELVTLHAKDDTPTTRFLIKRALTIILILSPLVLGASLLLGEPVLAYGFGSQFSEGGPAMTLLLAAALLAVVSGTFSMLVQIWMSPVRLLKIFVISSIGYCIVAPPSIYTLGISGAAIGQLLFVGLQMFFCIQCLKASFKTAPIVELKYK